MPRRKLRPKPAPAAAMPSGFLVSELVAPLTRLLRKLGVPAAAEPGSVVTPARSVADNAWSVMPGMLSAPASGAAAPAVAPSGAAPLIAAMPGSAAAPPAAGSRKLSASAPPLRSSPPVAPVIPTSVPTAAASAVPAAEPKERRSSGAPAPAAAPPAAAPAPAKPAIPSPTPKAPSTPPMVSRSLVGVPQRSPPMALKLPSKRSLSPLIRPSQTSAHA